MKTKSNVKKAATKTVKDLSQLTVPTRALVPVDMAESGLGNLPEMLNSADNAKDLALTGLSQRYVLGRTKSGRLTGTVENFGEFVMRKTTDAQHPHGMVVSQAHQDSVFKLHADWGKLPIISAELKKALSGEMDAVRKSFYAELKPAAIALHMDSRTEFRRMKLVRTKDGISLTSTAVVRAPVTSKEAQLQAELAKLKAELDALKGLVPATTLAKAKKKADMKPIDVGGNAVPANPETRKEVAEAQPIMASKDELQPA